MKRHRLTNRQKDWVRDSLTFSFERLGCTHAEATAIVTTGSVPMFIDVSRRVARSPEYAERREVTFPAFARAFADWCAYKAGVRPASEEAEEGGEA